MVKIGTKLGIGTGVLVALSAAIGLISYQQTHAVGEKLSELAQIREPANSAVYQLENHLVETAFAAFGYAATGDNKFVDAYERSRRDTAVVLRAAMPGVASGRLTVRDSLLRLTFEGLTADAAAQIVRRSSYERVLDSLLGEYDALDRLLVDRIQASVRADDPEPVAYRRLQVVLGMQIQLNTITRQLTIYLLTGEREDRDRVETAERKLREFAQAYGVLLLRPEERRWVVELRQRLARVLEMTAVMRHLEEERRVQLARFLGSYRSLKVFLDEGVKSETERGLETARVRLLEAGSQANTTILVALVLSVLFGIGTGFVTARHITRPLEHMAGVMRAIAGGERSRRVHITTNDELRIVGETFNRMTDQLETAERARLANLRISAASMQRVQEDERGRISRELHDGVCQRLTGTKYRVEVLQEQIPPGNRRMARELEDVTQELDRSINEVRRISSNLRPSVLDDFGLVAALRLLCSDLHRTHGIGMECIVPDETGGAMDATMEIALYRIAQEALTNVIKHARAQHVRLTLEVAAERIRMTIEDDGTGFAPEDVRRSRVAGHGFGLRSMAERAELLGGQCEVTSEPRQGTTLIITLPPAEEGTHA